MSFRWLFLRKSAVQEWICRPVIPSIGHSILRAVSQSNWCMSTCLPPSCFCGILRWIQLLTHHSLGLLVCMNLLNHSLKWFTSDGDRSPIDSLWSSVTSVLKNLLHLLPSVRCLENVKRSVSTFLNSIYYFRSSLQGVHILDVFSGAKNFNICKISTVGLHKTQCPTTVK